MSIVRMSAESMTGRSAGPTWGGTTTTGPPDGVTGTSPVARMLIVVSAGGGGGLGPSWRAGTTFQTKNTTAASAAVDAAAIRQLRAIVVATSPLERSRSSGTSGGA